MAAKRQSKYYVGMILKHKHYDFTIRLLDKQRSCRWIFEVVTGEFPKKLRPDTVFDYNLETYPVYSYDTIRTSFIPLTDSPIGKLLYGV